MDQQQTVSIAAHRRLCVYDGPGNVVSTDSIRAVSPNEQVEV